MSKNVSSAPLIDWHLLPWLQIEKFVFSIQSQIYKAALCNSKETIHQLQLLLVNSYSAKLFVVKEVVESKFVKRGNNANNHFNTLNSSQKIYLALSVKVDSLQVPLEIKKDLVPLYDFACQSLLYLCLQPEWEAYSKNKVGNQLFDQNIHSLIQSVAYNLNLLEFTNKLYVGIVVIERGALDINWVLDTLSTVKLFSSYISSVLNNQKDVQNLFQNIDISRSQLENKNLNELLSHVLCLSYEERVFNKNDKKCSLYFYRYQNNILIFSNNLEEVYSFLSRTCNFLFRTGLTYNKKKTRILTKQQTFRFMGFEIIPKFLVIKDKVYNQAYLNASKEEKKLVLAKARYILRTKHKDGKTRAKTNMPLSKAIALINPLVVNWRKYYKNFIPRATLDNLDWLLNEKIYRWYIKRLKKNRVTHWNKKCIQIIKNKKRIAHDSYVLELFNDLNI
uniref:putative reverse transcriptase/maturase n=1 Tax=Sahlingia subintegra TaxID=468936 RepID=UPI001FCCCE56|nr:putative reverse transcriptase/maturase [Sahlingia subintegra]UNJ17382.1 putative reverse transcriptase/maturase [Sahlingia subintegra]